MKKTGLRYLVFGIAAVAAFGVFTLLLTKVDVQPVGQNGTNVGFAALNLWFHRLTGVHTALYVITDWMGLVPILVCVLFAAVGLSQWIGRRSIRQVDSVILLLGVYYTAVILCYATFEAFPLNYRPILIDGNMEASYPSSTTLLTLSVMPTLPLGLNVICENAAIKKAALIFAVIFSVLTVTGRLISGVHWLTDIVGSVLLSAGIFSVCKAAALLCRNTEN